MGIFKGMYMFDNQSTTRILDYSYSFLYIPAFLQVIT